jgi:hypothetical protein
MRGLKITASRAKDLLPPMILRRAESCGSVTGRKWIASAFPGSLLRGKRATWKACFFTSLHFEDSLQLAAGSFNPAGGVRKHDMRDNTLQPLIEIHVISTRLERDTSLYFCCAS